MRNNFTVSEIFNCDVAHGFIALIFRNVHHCLWQCYISDCGTETVTTFMSPQHFSFHTNAVGTVLRFSSNHKDRVRVRIYFRVLSLCIIYCYYFSK